MNLLVVHGSKSEREAIAALFAAHHRVEAAASNAAALQCLDRCCPDVVLLQRTKLRVPVAKLEEGMVLEVDLRNDSGALVLPTGTRLTLKAVERLSSLLGARFMVEVSAGS